MEPEPRRETGLEWVIDVQGCDPRPLAASAPLKRLFKAFVRGMDLHPAAPAQWHQFPNTGGFTGMLLLKESHLTVHTFPENGVLCLNLFCCCPRTAGDFVAWFQEFRPQKVTIRLIDRHVTGLEGSSEMVRPFEPEPRRLESGGCNTSEVHRSLADADPIGPVPIGPVETPR